MRAGLLLLAFAAALLAACTTTTTTTSTPGNVAEGRTLRNPGDADPERRARARLDLASAYLSQGQPQTALDEVKLALAAKADMPEAYSLLGLIHGALGDPRQAEDSFRRALQLAPADGDVMHNYGWFLCNQRRYAESEAQFAAAMAQPQYRDSARTLLAQGVCQARAGRWEESERTLAKSFERDPANPATAFNLAEVLYRRGEYERARFYIKRVNTAPDAANAQSLWLAARIERRMGNMDGLQDFARQLHERYPQSPEVTRLDQGRFDD